MKYSKKGQHYCVMDEKQKIERTCVALAIVVIVFTVFIFALILH